MIIKTIICLVFFLGVTNQLLSQNALKYIDTIAIVDTEPICFQEFTYFTNKNRASVIGYYRSEYELIYGKGFWDTKINGLTPAEELKSRALNEAVKVKVQQILAKKHGLVNDISYSYFLKLLENENRRRQLAVKNQQVIFGPVQYSETVYYDYLFSNLMIALKKELANSVFQVTNDQLKLQYETLKDSLFQIGYHTKANVISLKKSGQHKGGEEQLNIIRRQLKNGISVNSILEENLQLTNRYVEINDSIYRSEGEEDFMILLVNKVGDDLAGIGVSDVIVNENGTYIVKIEERQFLGYRNFESCQQVVKDSYVDFIYHKLIGQSTVKTDVRIDSSNYRKYNL